MAIGSRFFFKFHHNMKLGTDRKWYYYCAPEIDVIEVTKDCQVIAYELKGSRRHKSGVPDFPAVHDPLGQAIAYLDLPRICQGDTRLFDGGVFDAVYAVCARATAIIDPGEERTVGVAPIGFMFALPDGSLVTIKEAPKNTIQNQEAKAHFVQNLHTLERHNTQSRIFRRIEREGQPWFALALR
ncbi:MAG: hypothetical protein ACLQAT_01030 [Candidatus Binataceae bacterium]